MDAYKRLRVLILCGAALVALPLLGGSRAPSIAEVQNQY